MSVRFIRPSFVVALLLCGIRISSVEAQDATAIVSNATPRDFQSISAALQTLETTARKGDANALAYYGATPPADTSPLQISSRLTHISVSASGALVRQVYGISIQRAFPVALAAGTQELWLARGADGTFSLTPTRFPAPPDALAQL
ncbi:MAG: hypothetical protein EOO38_29880, partial [Cytophagaceae bacterium]